jgi:hypothetical protein
VNALGLTKRPNGPYVRGMVRKAGIALFLLAMALIGFQPINMPAASMQAVAMDAQQPCCPDCDQPATPADGGCSKLVGCMTATPCAAMPAQSLVPVSYATRVDLLPADQSPTRAADVSPPFRPPRLSILV